MHLQDGKVRIISKMFYSNSKTDINTEFTVHMYPITIKIRFYVPRRNLYLISLTVISKICVPKEVAKLFEQLQQLLGRVVVNGLHLRRRHVVDDEKRHLVKTF